MLNALYATLTPVFYASASYSCPTAKILVGTAPAPATASSTYWRLTTESAVGAVSAAPDSLIG